MKDHRPVAHYDLILKISMLPSLTQHHPLNYITKKDDNSNFYTPVTENM